MSVEAKGSEQRLGPACDLYERAESKAVDASSLGCSDLVHSSTARPHCCSSETGAVPPGIGHASKCREAQGC